LSDEQICKDNNCTKLHTFFFFFFFFWVRHVDLDLVFVLAIENYATLHGLDMCATIEKGYVTFTLRFTARRTLLGGFGLPFPRFRMDIAASRHYVTRTLTLTQH
jgi:hypothetical protein